MAADYLIRPLLIRPFAEPDRSAVIDLWDACGLLRRWNDPDKDIDRKLAHSPDGLLVAVDASADTAVVVGAVMAGYDGHRGWINYLATSPGLQQSGIGRSLMDAAADYLVAIGCPKINLQIRSTNDTVIAFYDRIGYSNDDVVSMGKRLVDD